MMWRDARVVILGAARQGKALTRWLVAQGARVTLSDANAAADVSDVGAVVALALGGHPLSLLDGCDLLCLSGGVPIDLPIVQEARRRAIPLSNDSQIFFEECPPTRLGERDGIIGITGSAGKTTTTTLAGLMLSEHVRREELGQSQSGARVWVGGNIGNPLIADVERIGPRDLVVMELSSFQLDIMTRSPRLACITNITPNHLDRHGDMQAYIAAKMRILDYQCEGDWAVLCADDPVSLSLTPRAGAAWFSLRSPADGVGAWMDGGDTLMLGLPAAGRPVALCQRRELLLMGDHNVLNVLAAGLIAGIAGATPEAMREVAVTFKGVPHRLQLIRVLNGARWYDDSIATAPERLMAALRCFSEPVILLCGGRDKHLPWEEAIELMAERCKHVVLFGEMGPMVQEHVIRHNARGRVLRYTRADAFDEAVRAAAAVARDGDVVLLSPGGTSYDAFKDFAERGDRFAALVNQL